MNENEEAKLTMHDIQLPFLKSSKIYAMKPEKIFGEFPSESKIEFFNSDYCIFIKKENEIENLGFKTIRFNVKNCYLNGFPDDDRVNIKSSDFTMAMLYKNKVIVLEGKHRAIYVFQGGKITPELGGVLNKPDILEYSFDPDGASEDFFNDIIPIDNLINYKNPNTK